MRLPDLIHRYEGDLVHDALAEAAWRLRPAADRLGIPVSSLQRVLSRHPEIEAERQRQIAARSQV